MSFNVFLGENGVEIYNNDVDLLIEDVASVTTSHIFSPTESCYCHIIRVTNLYNNRSVIFTFYGSVLEYQRGIKKYYSKDLLDAFFIILEDVSLLIEYPCPESFITECVEFFAMTLSESFAFYHRVQCYYSKLRFIGLDNETIVSLCEFLRGYLNEE